MRTTRRHLPTHPREHLLAVHDGLVNCPRRGAMDLARCFRCPHFGGFQESATEALVCNHEVVGGLPDPA